METVKRSLGARGKFILSRALEKLIADPPEVQELLTSEMCDSAVYRKTIGDIVVEQMRQRGYMVVAPSQWIAEFEARKALLDRLKQRDTEQPVFNQSLKQAKERLNDIRIQADDETVESEEEWEDVDTSYASNKSISSKGACRKSSILSAKKSLKQMMQDSAKKGSNPVIRSDQSRPTRLKKNTSSLDPQSAKSERQPRALKRQASSVIAPDAKKDKKSSTLDVDKTEFARSQNSRVQLVKERKEIKDKERSELIKAKLQQKQMSFKEKEKKVPKQSKVTAKSTTSSGKSVRTVVATGASPATPSSGVKKASNDKQAPGAFVKPLIPAVLPPPSAGKNAPPESLINANKQHFNSMHSKALEDRRQGGLVKQAMYQSILAAGEENRGAINSTFLPGLESKPDFDASLALKGMKDTFVVESASNATFVSKPGLSPSKKNKPEGTTSSSPFPDSFNESYRDYGIDDLDSASDNTDDENAPTKPVPKWAEIKSARFKNNVKKQRTIGKDITKYGMMDVYVPPCVDLEMIFEEKSKRFDRHNASSGLWNDTQDFIR